MVDRSKETLNVIRAAMALAERDVVLGHVTVEQIRAIPRTRFAPVERDQAIALLKAEGKSNREIAKELGVSHPTVGKVVGGKKFPEGGNKLPPGNAADVGTVKASGRRRSSLNWRRSEDRKIGQQADRSMFLLNCDTAVSVANYEGPIDAGILKSCREVVRAWVALLSQMEQSDGKKES